jgi:hypothetical protein
MTTWQLNTPIVLLIFNRPDMTEKVFRQVAQARPSKLLVVADGPRPERDGEAEKCAATRAIIERVDWDCEVLKNYSDENLGCRHRISSGLDWVFETVEQAIILEDDCIPHPTFYRFCEELLDKYRDDTRVMVISGDNFQYGRQRTSDSYYFSRYVHIWGWATWRRAWKHYDVNMRLWPTIRDNGWLHDMLSDSRAIHYWSKIFQSTYAGQTNSWAYAWMFACWVQSGLTILPNVNLVSNIGFDTQSTHTQSSRVPYANMPTEPMTFPLQHPPYVIQNRQADSYTQNTTFNAHLLYSLKVRFKEVVLGLTSGARAKSGSP